MSCIFTSLLATVDKRAETQTQTIIQLASYLQYLESSSPDLENMGSNLLRGALTEGGKTLGFRSFYSGKPQHDHVMPDM
jgi:hypothetical protein